MNYRIKIFKQIKFIIIFLLFLPFFNYSQVCSYIENLDESKKICDFFKGNKFSSNQNAEIALNKVLNSIHLVINPRNVDHGLIKNLKINQKNVKKNNFVTKDRVDKHPLISYIQDMKEKQLTITSNNITQKQWSNLILELNLIKKAWAGYATLNIKAPGIKKIIAHGTRTNFKED